MIWRCVTCLSIIFCYNSTRYFVARKKIGKMLLMRIHLRDSSSNRNLFVVSFSGMCIQIWESYSGEVIEKWMRRMWKKFNEYLKINVYMLKLVNLTDRKLECSFSLRLHRARNNRRNVNYIRLICKNLFPLKNERRKSSSCKR